MPKASQRYFNFQVIFPVPKLERDIDQIILCFA
uniref:Uncharacterized protein n=1 Tax=Arundo donax TaxID=35708 RepID=A0A0A9CY79_ARUDO